MHGFGPVRTPDGELAYHEPWELRAQMVALVGGGELRPSIEGLDPATYLASHYYERWLLALEHKLLDTGRLDAGDIDRWRATFRDDPDARPPVSTDPDTVAAIRAIGPHVHGEITTSAFGIGDRVRVRRMRPERHHRCPRYIRGAVGEIERVCGTDEVPGSPREAPESEPVYTVLFSSVDLFGDRTADGEPPYTLVIDLWERYLETP